MQNIESEPHVHIAPDGTEIECYHPMDKIKKAGGDILTDWKFWLGMTIGFPFEHFLWTKVWPLYEITEALGLLEH